ncbi:hypothetical protein B0I35DRAFT_404473 [Stachybotrys elegans]|uniref:Apple domain-containing protein n=1 Tax=Stachybotrys elegans TaxID=80388 RepID=A0A8K0T2Y8_9HYPO|nr:hypothetical protein B0I35DRAFT_404473 [Stachybotrys elegans]
MDSNRPQHPTYEDGLEVVTYESGLEVVHDKKLLDGKQQQPSYVNRPTTANTTPSTAWHSSVHSPSPSPVPDLVVESQQSRRWAGKHGGFICGIRRQTFLIIIAVIVVLAVAAIGIGLGVGLSQGGRDKSEPVTSTADATIACPQSNDDVFQASDTNRYFRVTCGVDYSSADGARDIETVEAASMAECIEACAQRDNCVGAGWGTTNDVSSCSLKSNLGEPSSSASWIFTQEVDPPGEGKKNTRK